MFSSLRFPVVLAALTACSGDAAKTTDTGTTPTDTVDTDTVDTDTVDTDTGVAALALIGSYVDQYGTVHEITETEWTQTTGAYAPYAFDLTTYDNAEQVVIAQNGAANAYSAGMWSRFDWSDDGMHLWYCQTAYDAATEADALATPRADDSEPATTGCGGFPWTDLTP